MKKDEFKKLVYAKPELKDMQFENASGVCTSGGSPARSPNCENGPVPTGACDSGRGV